MARLNDPTNSQAIGKFFYSQNTGDSITWAGYIRVGAEGDTSGEDLLSVVNEKVGEAQLIDHGTADPTNTPGATEPWIYVDTGSDKIWLKERTGSPGSYSYSWAGPIHEGNSRTEIAYNTATARPNDPLISWNWETDIFNVTRNGWTLNAANAKWAMIVTLPRNTNNGFTSPAFRVTDPTAEDISYTPPTGAGNIPSSVSNVKEGLDTFHNATLGGGGGGGSDDQTAAEVPTTTTNFGKNIPQSASNVQTALDALDDQDSVIQFRERWGRISGALNSIGTNRSFTITPSLVTQISEDNERAFIEAEVDVRLQASVSPATASVTLVLDILTSTDTPVSGLETSIVIREASTNQDRTIRLIGILPSGFTAGKWRIRRTAITGSPPAVGIEGARVQVRSDVIADEVSINQDDLGNNITEGTDNLENAISQIDEFAIAIGTDFEDAEWPSDPNAIDSDGMEVRCTPMTIHRNIQNAMSRGVHYIAQIRFNARYEGGSTDGRTDIDADFRAYTNLSVNAILTTMDIRNQSGTATEYTYEVSLPLSSTGTPPNQLIFGFTAPTGQADARLEVTDFQVRIRDGINAENFTTDGRILNNSAVSYQEFAKQVYDYIIANAPVDPSGWGVNLPTTAPATIQGTFDRINSLPGINPNAANVSVASGQFSDPNNFIGGLREVTGLNPNPPDTPANVQQAFNKTDYLLQEAYNPYQSTQELDRSVGGGFTGTFTSNTTGYILSNDIDIPEEVRDLGVPAAVRFRARLHSLGAGYAGNIQLVSSDYNPSASPPNTVTYGAPEVINNTIYSGALLPPTYVSFQRTLNAPLPDTFKVRFSRSSSSGTAVFNDGFVDVVDTTAAVMGGAGGQASSYSTSIIWMAGPGINDRLITASETTNYTLMAGHNFSHYDQLVFVYDGGAGATQPLLEVWSDANLFQAFGANGLLDIKGNWWLMTSRQSDRTFRFRWRAPSNGLRRIIGIRTN